MVLALLGLSKEPGRFAAKTFMRVVSYLAVMCMGVGLVIAFVDAVDPDDYQKAAATASGVGALGVICLILFFLCICGNLKQQVQLSDMKLLLTAFALVLGIAVLGFAALACYQVEWDINEHTAMKVGACVTGASGLSLLVLAAALVLLLNQTVDSEEDRSTRTYSIFAILGLCFLSLLVLAGSCLVWLTDAIRGEDNVRQATAVAGGVLGVAGILALVSLLGFFASWTKLAEQRAANRTNELIFLVIAGVCVGIICVCVLLIVSWDLDWPGGQGPAVLGGFLGICGILSLLVMLYICASLPKWRASWAEQAKGQAAEQKPVPVPDMVPEYLQNKPMPDNVDAPTVVSWALDDGPADSDSNDV